MPGSGMTDSRHPADQMVRIPFLDLLKEKGLVTIAGPNGPLTSRRMAETFLKPRGIPFKPLSRDVVPGSQSGSSEVTRYSGAAKESD